MYKLSQVEIEAMYSQKHNHMVLHSTIRYELDKSLLNWALVAFMKIQLWMEGEYYDSKDTRIDTLKKHTEDDGIEAIVIAVAAAVMYTHTTQTIQQCVGYLQAYLPHEDAFERATTAGELLALCSGALYRIVRNGSGNPTTIEVKYWGLLDHKFLDSFEWINDTCFNLPMIEPPEKVTNNHMCGYKLIKEPLLLGKLTLHDEKQNYAPTNILNQIQWVLDPDVLAEPEVPSKPLSTAEQHMQFTAMVTASNFVYKLLGFDPFHFCWQNDSRGRLYSHGYHVNFQAAEYKKASLSFNKYEVLT